jgi:hypothetical protein
MKKPWGDSISKMISPKFGGSTKKNMVIVSVALLGCNMLQCNLQKIFTTVRFGKCSH